MERRRGAFSSLMNRRASLVVVPLSLVAALSLPAAAQAASCSMTGKTVASSPTARVYVTSHRLETFPRYYGCLRGQRSFLLGEDSDVGSSSGGDLVQLVTLNATYVGYVLHREGSERHTGRVRSIDLRTGHVKHQASLARPPGTEWLDADYSGTSLVLDAGGAIAWTTVASHDCPDVNGACLPTEWRVQKLDGRGSALLDTGTGTKQPLTLRGSTVTWQAGRYDLVDKPPRA